MTSNHQQMHDGNNHFRSTGKTQGAHGLHAEAPPFTPAIPSLNNLSPTKGEEPYQDIGMQSWSHGMDREAFVAGERAAMTRSLQMILPSQQALGMLGGGLQRLEAQVQEESLQTRQAALASADARAIAQGLSDRLNNLERIRLPAMDSQIQHAIEAPLSQEFRATLQGLQGALDTVHSRSQGPYSLTGFLLRQVGWLGAAASMYTQAAISRADVAAIFLSRKILLDTRVTDVEDMEGDLHSEGDSTSSFTSALSFAKSATGAGLFLAMVEASWQFHTRVFASVPNRLRRAVLPAQLGLRILRIATWAATLTLSAVYFRRGCHTIAETGISGIDRAVRAVYGRLPSRWTAADPKILAPTSPAESRTEDLEVSPKEEDPEHDTSQAVTHMTSFGLPQDQPAHRQRSVFDTPPPSPPPS